MRTTLSLVLLAGLAAGVASGAEAVRAGANMNSTQGAVEKPVADAATLYQAIDELWKRRDQADAVRAMDEKIREGMNPYGEQAGMLWRAARWQFWRAETSDAKDTRRALARLGYGLAEKAVAKEPDSVDARYWTAVNYGIYGEATGILTALAEGVEGKFRTNLDWAIQHQPGYEYGGGLCALGRYYASLPWPKRDRKKAVQTLRSALAQFPRSVRARVYLAEVLLDDGQAKEAKAVNDEALAAAIGAYDAPEEQIAQKMAKALKPRIDKELP